MANPWEQDWSQTSSPAPQGASSSAMPWDRDWSQPQGATWSEKLGQTWPARLAKGVANAVYSGVTLPGEVYQGKTAVDPSNLEFMGRVLDLATVASPVTPRTAASEVTAAGVPSAEALRASADRGYEAVRNSGVEYAPESVANMGLSLAQKLEEKGRNAARAPQTHSVVSELGNPPAGAVNAPIGGIDTARQALGHIASDPSYSATDRAAAEIAKRHIDEYLASVPATDVLAGDAASAAKSLRDAQRDFAASKRSEAITGAQEIAEGNAAAAGSGRNIDNAYRQRFNSILKSDRQTYGFSPEELARMESIRNGAPAANALRYVGNLMSGIGGQTTGALGAWMYNPAIAATPIVGHLLKKGADYSTLRQIKALDEATRMRSALGEAASSGPAVMTPAEQARPSALVKGLMAGTLQPAQTPSPNDQVMARFLMGGN